MVLQLDYSVNRQPIKTRLQVNSNVFLSLFIVLTFDVAQAGAPAFGLFGAKPSTPAASDKDKPAGK